MEDVDPGQIVGSFLTLSISLKDESTPTGGPAVTAVKKPVINKPA